MTRLDLAAAVCSVNSTIWLAVGDEARNYAFSVLWLVAFVLVFAWKKQA